MTLGIDDFLATASSATGRTPQVRIGRGGADGGTAGGLLAAAAGAVGLGDAAAPDPLTAALSSFDIALGAAPIVATCRLRFLPRADVPALAPGDPLTVHAGDRSAAPAPVFSGNVAAIGGGGGALDVLLAAPAARLARTRRNAAYENTAFADLLRGWADDAGVDVGSIDSGPRYAWFAIDDRLSLWDWVARVALHADLSAWTDARGRLQARRPGGAPAARFRWGETVLALDAHSRDPVTTGARIVGEGSAGRQGQDAWSWLAKDAQGVSAGGGPGAGAVGQDGALRELAAVAGAALGAAAGARRMADTVRLRVPGTPALDIAAVLTLDGCPGGAGDGSWSVRTVRHRWSARCGFVTDVLATTLA